MCTICGYVKFWRNWVTRASYTWLSSNMFGKKWSYFGEKYKWKNIRTTSMCMHSVKYALYNTKIGVLISCVETK